MSLNPDKVVGVILAGGFGTRLSGVLSDLPKPMAPVGDRPFLEWVIRYLVRQGISRFVVSTGYLGEAIDEYLYARPISDIEIQTVREEAPLGTAGGFLNVVHNCGFDPEGWLVINGDTLFLADYSRIWQMFQSLELEGALLGMTVPDASHFGSLLTDEDGYLSGFLEKQPGAGIVNAGVYFFQDRLVKEFPDMRPLSFETDVFPKMVREGHQMRVLLQEAPFIDIGTPEMLAEAEKFVENHRSAFL